MGLSRGVPGEDGISPGHVCGQGLRTAQAPQAAGLHVARPPGAQLEPGWHPPCLCEASAGHQLHSAPGTLSALSLGGKIPPKGSLGSR